MSAAVLRPVALVAITLSLVATATAEPAAWLLVAIAGFVAVGLAWAAFRDGSVAAPVVTLLVTSVLFVFVADGIAFGPLVGAVLALVAGELLWAAQAAGDQGRAVVQPVDAVRAAAATAATSSGVIAIVMVAARLPDRRIWSAAAVVGLVTMVVAVHRRRAGMQTVPLPPPPH